jgi:hypothetical protein
LFGKSVLQRWACFPSGISSALAGTCDWIDVPYHKAPAELTEPTDDRILALAAQKEQQND